MGHCHGRFRRVGGCLVSSNSGLIGLKATYNALLAYIKSQWQTSAFELHMLDNGFFVCKLDSGEDMQRILEGFWMVKGHPMILRKWSQDLRLEVDCLQSIPLWISLHGLPLHIWTRTCIAKLCSTIGEPLYLDKMTAERKRLSFARACVLVSSMKELPESITYEDSDGRLRSVRVSYPWRPRRCSACLSFGHGDGQCKKLQAPKIMN